VGAENVVHVMRPRRMTSRCQRTISVRGDQQPQPVAAGFRYHPEQGRRSARSAQVRFGRRGCRRCRTASWRRRIKISTVFHVSLRRDSRSHEVIHVIRRKTNRRHMTCDRHERTARRATLLVTTADKILGTHRSRTVCVALLAQPAQHGVLTVNDLQT
jgi:hypothetical protein